MHLKEINYLRPVNRIANQLISFLLLLCITATVIPFSLLHHHEETTHCDITNASRENDPCHISTYHANETQKQHCKHKAHVHETNSDCKLCKFITSHRQVYTLSERSSIINSVDSKANIAFEPSFSSDIFLTVIFNKGPPD